MLLSIHTLGLFINVRTNLHRRKTIMFPMIVNPKTFDTIRGKNES